MILLASTNKPFKGRSPGEVVLYNQLTQEGIDFEYESITLTYTSLYKPDFVLFGGIIIEFKGWHRAIKQDLAKMIKVKREHPEYDIRMVFQNAYAKHTKTMTYADWADKHGFRWAHKVIPEEWIKEFRELELNVLDPEDYCE